MARQDRRDFCRLAVAAGALALTGTTAFPGRATGTTAVGTADAEAGPVPLRELLLQHRNRIRSLDLEVTAEYVHVDPDLAAELAVAEGRSELHYRDGRYRVVRTRRDTSGEFSLTEVGSKSWGEQRVEWIRKPSSGVAPRPPYLSLPMFLPVPRNRPVYDLGVREMDGRQVRVLGQDDLHFYVDEDVPRVVGVDVFITHDEVGETIRYEEHRPAAGGVLFPRRIVARRRLGGRETARLEALVHSVRVGV